LNTIGFNTDCIIFIYICTQYKHKKTVLRWVAVSEIFEHPEKIEESYDSPERKKLICSFITIHWFVAE